MLGPTYRQKSPGMLRPCLECLHQSGAPSGGCHGILLQSRTFVIALFMPERLGKEGSPRSGGVQLSSPAQVDASK